jgi:hypothetical protein
VIAVARIERRAVAAGPEPLPESLHALTAVARVALHVAAHRPELRDAEALTREALAVLGLEYQPADLGCARARRLVGSLLAAAARADAGEVQS